MDSLWAEAGEITGGEEYSIGFLLHCGFYQCDALSKDGFIVCPGDVLPPDLEMWAQCDITANHTRIQGHTRRYYCDEHAPTR